MQDWVDELFDGKQASFGQIGRIEGLLQNANITNRESEEIQTNLMDYTEQEATAVINFLNQCQLYTDPKHQFEQRFGNHMHDIAPSIEKELEKLKKSEAEREDF